MAPSAAAKPPLRLQQNADDAFAELDHRVTLRFFDAVKGAPIAGADVDCFGHRAQTNNEGAATFPKPDSIGTEDTRDCVFRKSGYVTSKVPVKFLVGTIFQNRFSISPSLAQRQLRIVLDWGEQPADLDAHLIKEGSYHISYRDKQRFEDDAWLDHDSQSGFGPETITLQRVDPTATYRFIVHDFSHAGSRTSAALSDSRARVMVFSESGLLYSFAVPARAPGDVWSVFEVREGQVRPLQRVAAGRP